MEMPSITSEIGEPSRAIHSRVLPSMEISSSIEIPSLDEIDFRYSMNSPELRLSMNSPEPKHELTEDERKIIRDQLTIYAGEARKLNEEALRRSTSCIYRVLPRLKEVNGNGNPYEPNMVCIGPYNHKQIKDLKFQMAEDCKRKCFGSLLVKTEVLELQIETYMRCLERINELEKSIRECYSEQLDVSTTELVEMMVVDACFIIEIIKMFGPKEEVDSCESLAALAWMVPYFYRDFLLLENQIPFFVLIEIYALTDDISVQQSRLELMNFALIFFKYGMKRFNFNLDFFDDKNVPEWWAKDDPGVPLHLLDFVRRCSIPSNIRMKQETFLSKAPFFHCISKLRLAGIKVSQPVMARNFLEVKFKKGVIEMPNIAIDDLTRCLLLNCVAFEQCHRKSGKYFSAYATFLDCLVNTKDDVEYLRECNVIDNYLTEDSEAADFINCAGKDLVLANKDNAFYLGELFVDVNMHYRNRWRWKWASFEREYFDKPWLLLSAMGGILLVVATSFQAVMAFLSYKNKNC